MSVRKKISTDIAKAIEEYLTDCTCGRTEEEMKSILIAEHYGRDWNNYEEGKYIAFNSIYTFDLMECLVNGYEII